MREDHPHRRRLAKDRHQHERRIAGRTEGSTALIVCEGLCTEPYYLSGLRQLFQINPASAVIVAGQSDADAVAVVNRARNRFEQAPFFNQVFAVIDGEQANLAKAVQLCEKPVQRASQKAGRPEIHIQPIISSPCIEFWLLLHFAYTDQPFGNCADVIRALQGHLPDYRKADPKIFQKVGGEAGLGRAMAHVDRLISARMSGDTPSPSTSLPILIKALCAMRPSSGSNPLPSGCL
jgi:hypothetical protein